MASEYPKWIDGFYLHEPFADTSDKELDGTRGSILFHVPQEGITSFFRYIDLKPPEGTPTTNEEVSY